MPSPTLKLHVIIVISYSSQLDCEITEWATSAASQK